MTYAERVFIVQTLDRQILSESLKTRAYGISLRAFRENLPQELLDLPMGSAAFIRLKSDPQPLLFGPVFTSPIPDTLRSSDQHGIWYTLDAHHPSSHLPAFHEKFPCCFFFEPMEPQRFGVLAEADLEQDGVTLPPWGLLTPGVGRKLIAMARGGWDQAVAAMKTRDIPWNAPPPVSTVLTVPPHLKDSYGLTAISAASTDEALKDLFRRAHKEIRIFSPYIDATFLNLIQDASVPIKVITTPHRHRTFKPNPVLERLTTQHDLQVRYIAENRKGAHMFQLHAKMILCDRAAAYVGSANLTDTSVYYNIELGLLVADSPTLAHLDQLFTFLFYNVAVPAEELSRSR